MTPTADNVRALIRPLNSVLTTMSKARRKSTDPIRHGVLEFVLREAQARPSEIARELQTSASTVTRQIQALQDEGRLTLRPDPQDRRASLLSITETGIEDLAAVEDTGVLFMLSELGEWSDDDVVTLARLLDKLVDTLSDNHHARVQARISRSTDPATAPSDASIV